MEPQADLETVSFAELSGWAEDDHLAAFVAYRASAERIVANGYKPRPFNADITASQRAARSALAGAIGDKTAARNFFERSFRPFRIKTAGFLTGFFEPVLPASLHRSEHFGIPLLRRPADLCDVDETNRPSDWDDTIRFGRATKAGIEPYADRGEIHRLIELGAMDSEAICWLADPVDAFFIHVQGAAKLDLDPTLPANDPARYLRVTYDGKSGHAYTSIARILCQRLDIDPATMTADRLAAWLRENPQQRDTLIEQNRSYIFFRPVEGLEPAQGPIAAAKVPLHPGRSLAVDRMLHTFGTPVWLETETALPGEEKSVPRLTIAHDTGSAIVGAARADLFTGSGPVAGHKAGRIRHSATLTLLLPVVQP